MPDGYAIYRTQNGDMFDKLALDAYLDEEKSSLIRQANPAYRDYVVLPGGIDLIIPLPSAEPLPQSLPPWRR